MDLLAAAAENLELSMRWLFAVLGIPEQPDSFWEDMASIFASEMTESAALFLNAVAVMADATQWIEES